MTNDRTELIFILDRSGSMSGLEADTVGGFNTTLADNQALSGECTVTTILFNQQVTLLHDRLPVQAVKPLTTADYRPAGMTALLDAVGYGMDKIAAIYHAVDEAYRPRKVQFVIMTDGMENASQEYNLAKIRQRITEARERYGWDFIFLGANIDAISTADDMGIAPGRSVNARADKRGLRAQFCSVSRANVALRTEDKCMSASWAEPVMEDISSRDMDQ